MSDYALLDSGRQRKLERFGSFTLQRPCSQAVWEPLLSDSNWEKAHAHFCRDGGNKWEGRRRLPEQWSIEVEGIRFQLSATDFGHLGIFPEQRQQWKWMRSLIQKEIKQRKKPLSVLNLFAYSGGSTLACAQAGAQLCHVDASKGMVAWARENAELNGLVKAPIRWIVDDVNKFLEREKRRQRTYDAIILDPPTFGRGAKGETFKIEEEIMSLLQSCKDLLSSSPLFFLYSCHTPGFTPIVMENQLHYTFRGKKGCVEKGEMLLEGEKDRFSIPSGAYARWIF